MAVREVGTLVPVIGLVVGVLLCAVPNTGSGTDVPDIAVVRVEDVLPCAVPDAGLDTGTGFNLRVDLFTSKSSFPSEIFIISPFMLNTLYSLLFYCKT